MKRPICLAAILLLLSATSATTPTVAHASYPGRNGLIVFEGWVACVAPHCVSPANPAYDLWTVASDGTGLTNITNAPGVDTSAVWSPDGSKIAFASNRNGDYDLFVTDPDGSNTTQITRGVGDDGDPTWGPSGRRIAFLNYARRTTDIVVMRPDGSRRKRIASFEYGYGLQWSPDGRWLALTKVTEKRSGIVLIRPDGSERRWLTPKRIGGESPAWAPDGKRITFTGWEKCTECDHADIFVIRRDGAGLRKLVDDELWQSHPAWSPDGKEIVYTSEVPGTGFDGDLWIIAADGSNKRRLIAKADSWDWNADWQPLP
ncbi:MAG: hypothetical protein M3198_03805 [Actinomycetota bacterium]|nr:hypothetical protein [Actinomycetota bacterium]